MAMGLMGARAQVVDPVRPPSERLLTAEASPGAPPGPPPSSQEMPRILNDSVEYCDELRDDIARIRARRGGIPDAVAMLTREGERMCRIGHIRPGIYRLRTALMMLRRNDQ